MSLINQVLLDLDRRHAQPPSVPLSAHSVTQSPRKSRLALRIAAAFVAVGAGAGAAVVASTAMPLNAEKAAISQGVITPAPVAANRAASSPRDTALVPTTRSNDPFAADESNAIGGNPLGGTAVRVASNSNDDVQLLAMSPALPGNVSNAERAVPASAGDDANVVAPAARMPRMWDASPAATTGPRPKAAAPVATSWADESNVATPDTRVASLSPTARRAASTAQSVIEAQDPDATIRKARSMVKPSVVRTEVKAGSGSDAAEAATALAPSTTVAFAPTVIPSATRRPNGRVTTPAPAVVESTVEKRSAPLSAADRADVEYQKALALHLQGQTADARVMFATALREDRRHAGARQALAVGLVGDGKLEEAQAMLAEGLDLNPRELQLSATLARIQTQRQDLPGAMATLKAALAAGPMTAQKGEVADARALLATLQQRSGAHAEAIENYSQALRQVPGNGTWWIGLGVSLAAAGRAESARDAFQRARATDSLSPDLDRYVEQRLLATAAR